MEKSDSTKSTHESFEDFKEKSAARVVLLDELDRVAILHVSTHDYYKIPGGGVETGEDIRNTAIRETLEEAGANCRIAQDLGEEVVTYLPDWKLKDVSHGFIARMIGEQNSPKFEEWERERGFKLIWAESLNAAINIFEKNEVNDTDQKSLQERDLGFLKLAKKILEQPSSPNS